MGNMDQIGLEINKDTTPSKETKEDTTQSKLEIKEEQVITFDMNEYIGKDVSVVKKAVEEKYGGKYTFPDEKQYYYLLNNPDKVPESLKDGNRYYFTRVMTYGQGTDIILAVKFSNGELKRSTGYCSANPWESIDRVLLLEK